MAGVPLVMIAMVQVLSYQLVCVCNCKHTYVTHLYQKSTQTMQTVCAYLYFEYPYMYIAN